MRQQAFGIVEQHGAVGQSGERIVECRMTYFFLCIPPMGNIAKEKGDAAAPCWICPELDPDLSPRGQGMRDFRHAGDIGLLDPSIERFGVGAFQIRPYVPVVAANDVGRRQLANTQACGIHL